MDPVPILGLVSSNASFVQSVGQKLAEFLLVERSSDGIIGGQFHSFQFAKWKPFVILSEENISSKILYLNTVSSRSLKTCEFK